MIPFEIATEIVSIMHAKIILGLERSASVDELVKRRRVRFIEINNQYFFSKQDLKNCLANEQQTISILQRREQPKKNKRRVINHNH